MADGYQLDYKKVHNTLGEPNKCKYGEEIGQYVTNLWNNDIVTQYISADSDPSSPFTPILGNTHLWQYEGILEKGTSSYTTSTYLYNKPYEPFVGSLTQDTSFTVKIKLIDYNVVITGSLQFTYNTNTWTTTCAVGAVPYQDQTLHFKITQIVGQYSPILVNGTYDPLDFFIREVLSDGVLYLRSWYRTNLIPLTPGLLHTIKNWNSTFTRYAIFGYDSKRDEYVYIQNDTGYVVPSSSSVTEQTFIAPSTGIATSNTPTMTGITIAVDQWYIIFHSATSTITEPHLFFTSSIPLAYSKDGLITDNNVNTTIITLNSYVGEMYDDAAAFDILRTYAPVVTRNINNIPTAVSLPAKIKENKFKNWLIYKKYNLALVTVKDHRSTEKIHSYHHNGSSFTVTDRRYCILKYLKDSKLKLPTYEWSNSNLTASYSFSTLDSSKELILSRREDVDPQRPGRLFVCAKSQIINQCQLSGPDGLNSSQQPITHICFALWIVPQHGTYYNSDHINNGSFITEIPQNESYYASNIVELRSYLW